MYDACSCTHQSYVWNAIVSEPICKYGSDKPVAGDLIFEYDYMKDHVMEGEMGMRDIDDHREELGMDNRKVDDEGMVLPSIYSKFISPMSCRKY